MGIPAPKIYASALRVSLDDFDLQHTSHPIMYFQHLSAGLANSIVV
jgi:hypothetical protein